MTEVEISRLIFGILQAIGCSVLILLAFLTCHKYLIQEKRCTAKTKGIIRKYTTASRGTSGVSVFLPVVYYTVDGKEYKTVGPRYKGIISSSVSSPLHENQSRCWEEGQYLHIRRTSNSFVGVHPNPIADLYPLNSEIDVYYDPNHPKLSYVLRYCNMKWVFWLMFLSGVGLLLINVLVLVLL